MNVRKSGSRRSILWTTTSSGSKHFCGIVDKRDGIQDVDLNEALLVWATQKRRRDRGEPFEADVVVAALRIMFRWTIERGETIDATVPRGLALGISGVYDVDSATDEEILRLAEDMYQQSRASDDLE